MKNSILHIIKTKSYESDGRLLKWVQSLKEDGIVSDIFLVEDNNTKGVFRQGQSTLFKRRFLTRFVFKKYTGYPLKIAEYALKFLPFLFKKKYEIVVFHDVQQYFNILITLLGNNIFWKKKIVWDLHELPHPVLTSNAITKKIVKYLLEGVDLIVYTNQERREYILEKYQNREKKHSVLNNYPSTSYVNELKSDLPSDLQDWILKGEQKPYILWMGSASIGRNFDVFFETFQKFQNNFKLVIMGGVESVFAKEIEEYQNEGKVFVNFVKQDEIIQYVDNAQFSVVLYSDKTPNNYYCEPNRLYQLVTRKIPVIVGYNPVLKNTVHKFNAGVVLDDAGSSVDKMEAAFHELIANIDGYYNQRIDLNWESQFRNVYTKISVL